MRVYNTLTNKKEDFKPINDREVKIYVCGPTVYNYFHIGNARPFVVFDTLRRYLEYRGKKVDYVQNFTDVDDKIINKAKEDNVKAGEVSEKYIDEYYKDAEALNIKKATVHPKVTENINEIIDFVKTLIDKGYAYEVDGDVYFNTQKFPGYGTLSGQDLDALEIGARVDVNDRKKDPLDFVLWKHQKEDEEIAWDSPWGKGRPGWHIECSAMSKRFLGDTIDIHAGGEDLTFPHHENEIAQSEAANGAKFANYWMHNGYITVNNEKMSKSKGNFFTVRDILQEYDGEVIRFFLLSGHYRSPINFSRELMESAKSGLARMQNAKSTLEHLIDNSNGGMTEKEKSKYEELENFRNRFISAMDDDLNTAEAIGVIFELISEINTTIREDVSKEFAGKSLDLLLELAHVLGLLENTDENEVNADIEALVNEREAARKNKDFARADEIRDELEKRGITLKDTPQGVQIIRE